MMIEVEDVIVRACNLFADQISTDRPWPVGDLVLSTPVADVIVTGWYPNGGTVWQMNVTVCEWEQ